MLIKPDTKKELREERHSADPSEEKKSTIAKGFRIIEPPKVMEQEIVENNAKKPPVELKPVEDIVALKPTTNESGKVCFQL